MRSREAAVTLECFPITWNQLIDKEALDFKDLEHVGMEEDGPRIPFLQKPLRLPP